MSAPAVEVRFTDRRSAVGLAALAAVIGALAAAPWWAGRDDLHLLGEIFAYVALASLWNLLAGYAGLVSVGQQAFVGLGGYVLFGLAILAGVSPLWAIAGAGLVGAVAAVPVAALVFRLRGHYFAIGTWVVAEVFRLLASQVAVLGGGSGTSLPAAIVIAIAPICTCWRSSSPTWRWRACGTCSPATPAWSRSGSRPMSASAPICCSP